MNWNRVLSIFILIFAGLNVFLYFWINWRNTEQFTLSEERRHQLQTIMEKKGVNLYSEIPDFYPMAKLDLRVVDISHEKAVKTVFKKAPYTFGIEYKGLVADSYRSKGQSLIFYSGDKKGTIYYKADEPSYVPDSLALKSFEKTALQFATDLLADKADFAITYRRDKLKGYRFEMNQLFRDKPIFSSYLRVEIEQDGIKEVLATYYEPIDYQGEPRHLVPFDEVVYHFIDYLATNGEQQVTIKDADVGYYVYDPKRKQLQIEATPVYRFILDDDSRYYVDAYENTIIEN